MATILVSSPTGPFPAGNDLEFQFTGDADPNIKIAYQGKFRPTGGTEIDITDVYTVNGQAGIIKVNFSRDVSALLKTMYNEDYGSVPAASNDSSACGVFRVAYGESVFDPVTKTSTLNLHSGSAVDVFNSVIQYKDFNVSGTNILSYRPLLNYICHDQSDWIHVLSDGNVTITFKTFDSDGVELFTDTVIQPATTNPVQPVIIPVGPRNGLLKGKLKGGAVKYTIDINGIVYTFILCDCEFEYEIHWLEPPGGWAGLAFKFAQTFAESTIERFNSNRNNPVGGGIILQPQTIVSGVDPVSLLMVNKWNREGNKFLQGLVNSSDVRIRINENGRDVIRRFVINGSRTPIYNTNDPLEFSINGIIGEDFKTLSI